MLIYINTLLFILLCFKKELTKIDEFFILTSLIFEIYLIYKLTIIRSRIKFYDIFYIVSFVFSIIYLPEIAFPHIEYKSYLQQASDEGNKTAEKFYLEMSNKGDYDIYHELISRTKTGHDEYVTLQPKTEEIKKNDKRRKSIFWNFRSVFNDFKNLITSI